MKTQFPTTTLPDAPIIIDALYRFTNADRSYIDGQILGIQQIVGPVLTSTLAALASAAAAAFPTVRTMAGASLALVDTVNVIVRATAANGHTLTLPTTPTTGQTVSLQIEDTSLTSGDITANGGGKNIQFGVTSAATYVVTKAVWGDGAVVEFQYNGSFWKVV